MAAMSASMLRCGGQRRGPADHAQRTQVGQLVGGAGHDHRVQRATLRQTRRQRAQAVGRGHQHAHGAVAGDEGDLIGFEQRIDRHEHATGGSGAEHRAHVLDALFKIDGDALAAAQAQRQQRAGHLPDLGRQAGIVEAPGAMYQRFGARRAARGFKNKIVDEVAHRSPICFFGVGSTRQS
jgi:hypothetical protein